MARESYVFVYMPGSGFLLASAARPTGVASRKDLLPTVMPSLWGKVSDGNLLSTHREDEGAAGDLCVVERDDGDFSRSQMVLPATFAQANELPEPLMQSDVVPATLVESTVLQPLGGRGLGRDLAVARTACPRGGGANLVVDVRADV